jgi:hypothetical protein
VLADGFEEPWTSSGMSIMVRHDVRVHRFVG